MIRPNSVLTREYLTKELTKIENSINCRKFEEDFKTPYTETSHSTAYIKIKFVNYLQYLDSLYEFYQFALLSGTLNSNISSTIFDSVYGSKDQYFNFKDTSHIGTQLHKILSLPEVNNYIGTSSTEVNSLLSDIESNLDYVFFYINKEYNQISKISVGDSDYIHKLIIANNVSGVTYIFVKEELIKALLFVNIVANGLELEYNIECTKILLDFKKKVDAWITQDDINKLTTSLDSKYVSKDQVTQLSQTVSNNTNSISTLNSFKNTTESKLNEISTDSENVSKFQPKGEYIERNNFNISDIKSLPNDGKKIVYDVELDNDNDIIVRYSNDREAHGCKWARISKYYSNKSETEGMIKARNRNMPYDTTILSDKMFTKLTLQQLHELIIKYALAFRSYTDAYPTEINTLTSAIGLKIKSSVKGNLFNAVQGVEIYKFQYSESNGLYLDDMTKCLVKLDPTVEDFWKNSIFTGNYFFISNYSVIASSIFSRENQVSLVNYNAIAQNRNSIETMKSELSSAKSKISVLESNNASLVSKLNKATTDCNNAVQTNQQLMTTVRQLTDTVNELKKNAIFNQDIDDRLFTTTSMNYIMSYYPTKIKIDTDEPQITEIPTDSLISEEKMKPHIAKLNEVDNTLNNNTLKIEELSNLNQYIISS